MRIESVTFRQPNARSERTASRRVWLVAPLAGLLLASAPARALDGCLVLLCLAAPSWRAIPQCVPPVRQLFRDLARGRPFPGCAMAGAGSQARHAWSAAPSFCPPQYTRRIELESGTRHECDFIGAVSVTVDGAPFTQTWWNFAGHTITEFSPAAKAQFGHWDTSFDDDHARWLASCPGC